MRSFFTAAIVAVFISFVSSPLVYGDEASLTPGETFKGEHAGNTEKIQNGPSGGNWTMGYNVAMSIPLKAGQNFSANCVVIGKSRRVIMELFNPEGKSLGISDWNVKTTKFTVEEVNVTGNYRVEIRSDMTGPFTVTNDVTEEQPDIDALEVRVKQLKAALADAEDKLKAAKSAKPGK